MDSLLFQSPWLHQLNRTRGLAALDKSFRSDMAVIGGGIAGICTAYFLLKKTQKTVLVIEADRVAHGATGHNAGQLVSYFERPFHDIVREFGLDKAAAGQRGIESAWDLLTEIRQDLSLKGYCYLFEGYAGCADLEELKIQLKNNVLKKQAGLQPERLLVSEAWAKKVSIPVELQDECEIVSQQHVLDCLETDDSQYGATLVGKKGCLNSAKFCEEVVSALLHRYPERFRLAEKVPIHTVELHQSYAILKTDGHVLTADRVVLATNGFEHFKIINKHGRDIDKKFHHLVQGSVGYMAGFLDASKKKPAAISYFPKHRSELATAYESDPYFYLTRRPNDQMGEDGQKNLICVGGPEALLSDTSSYHHDHPYPKTAHQAIDRFLAQTYRHASARTGYRYFWHGLMGYTPNGLRCVGAEPSNPVLLYNLGCNGVGILPSIYGGWRIAQLINGDLLPESIFDPQKRIE